MTSKVTAKLPLGVAFSMLLISLALFVGCKQDVAPQDSYTPPGYGATVGYLTDTTWKSGNDTIKFGAEGSVTVPNSMKKMGDVVELGDFTYSVFGTTVTISAKVKNASADLSGWISAGDIIDVATCTIGTTASSGTTSSGDTTYDDYTSGDGTKEGSTSGDTTYDDYTSGDKKGESASNGTQGSSTSTSGTYKYYQMKVSIELGGFLKFGEEKTYTMENRPNSGDKFVGTYYDKQGIKSVQINKDGTFVNFTSGGKNISYWIYNDDGTISVKSEPFTNSSNSGTSSTTPTIYYLYPHALMEDGYVESYK